MKKYYSIIILLAVCGMSFAQADGIKFRHEGWDEILAEAKANDKIIFVDAYTTWCGPCKWMSANVFPEKMVGTYYNNEFINVKLDMEKGEGIAFAKKYQVRAYPTLLYIDGQGEVVHKSLGSRDADKFLELGKVASDPNANLKGLKARYVSGTKDASFLRQYATTLMLANMDATSIANEYFAGQTDWNTKENAEMVFELAGFDLENKYFKHMLAHRSVYEERFPDIFDQKLEGAIGSTLGRDASMESTTQMYQKYYPNTWEQKMGEFALRKKMYANDEASKKEFLEGAVAYIHKYQISDWSFLNSMAWRVYEISDNPMYLMEAKNWALKSIQDESNFFNNDTAAALYYKLKQKDEAMHFALMAVELAKAEKADYSETTLLIEKINEL